MEISVLTAVYNGEEYLKESIESILKQTFPHFEYIIVNDGSDDKTKEILDSITDPRVKVFHLEKNVGAANALNIGISQARGKWIALQDADDISIENRLQIQLQYIQSDSGLVAVGSLVQCIPGNDQVDQSSLKESESFFNRDNFRNDIFGSTPICNGTGFFLKSAYEKIGGYDPTFKIAYDTDLWTRMLEVGEISRCPEVLYKYRVHKNSLSHNDIFAMDKEHLLCTFKNIAGLRFNNLNRKPKMLMISTHKRFEYYRKNFEDENRYLMISFLGLGLKNARKAYSLYQSNEIDGILLVSRRRSLLRFFTRKGLLLGGNLFKINIWIH